jgi:uridylate kinase
MAISSLSWKQFEFRKCHNMGMAYQRVLLKLSGEALMGELAYGIDPLVVQEIAQEVAGLISEGVEVAIVVGGGNIFRGVKGAAAGMDRATADYIGMIATVMNAMTLQDALEQIEVPTRVLTAIEMQEVAEPVYSSPRHSPFRERPRRDLRSRIRQPVLHDGYDCCFTCRRDQR